LTTFLFIFQVKELIKKSQENFSDLGIQIEMKFWSLLEIWDSPENWMKT